MLLLTKIVRRTTKNVGLYKPMSLGEVGTFVKTYRHLPGIKSAADYEKEGSVNVGELQ